MNNAVQKAKQANLQGPELDEAAQNVQKGVSSFQSEPNKTYMSAIERMAEIFENMSMLTTEMALNYVNLRRSLEAATSVAKVQVDTQTGAASKAHAETLEENKRHEEERSTLLTKVDQLQTALDKAQNELLAAKTEITRQGEDLRGSARRFWQSSESSETRTSAITRTSSTGPMVTFSMSITRPRKCW